MSLIGAMKATCGEDEEAFRDMTKHITTYVQTREILAGRGKLRNYEPKRRKELFQEALMAETHAETLPAETVDTAYEEWEKSGLTFHKWWIETSIRL